MKQRIFTSDYVRKLREGVENRSKLHRYKNENFVFDEDQTLIFPTIHQPQDLLDSLDANNDLKTAIKIYEAYKKLELLQASDIRFWIYLSHADLYEYVKYRWDGKITKDYVLDHWFIDSPTQGNLLRHSISQLWWAVHLSIDQSRSDKYELTRVLFTQRDFPFRTLGAYRLGRHKEAVIGILEFIMENHDMFKSNFQSKSRFITRHLNQVGGIKPLSYYRREFFKSELEKIKSAIRLK